jgi:pimeloyl-ACP methyl ester carboxylesterase
MDRKLTLFFIGITFLWNSYTFAQTNVRAWNADGQVFIVWEISAQPALTYRVFMNRFASGTTTGAISLGAVFEPEWSGARLKLAKPNATWRVPDGNGGFYQLAGNEGLFVFTPHEADNQGVYFMVVKDNEITVTDSNRTAQPITVVYDPINQSVKCHLQFTGIASQSFPYAVFAMWADGRNDPNDARPDFPIMANAAKNGAPHVFAVFQPADGLPAEPYPAVVCLHGGGPQGSYWAYAPNSIHYRNTGNVPVNGVTIAFDDRLYISNNGTVNTDRPSNWFGWHTQMTTLTASVTPANAIVVPYTLRRLIWTLDWLLQSSSYNIDSTRIAIMGNSMGGTGTLLLSRWKPERFSAATAFVPPHYTPETGSRLFGNTQTNLKTTEIGPDGDTLRVNDFFDPAIRISATQRDYPITRIYRGRCDEAAEWGSQHIQLYNQLNNIGMGIHLYWDNRDHTASDWTVDDPQTSCPDLGQWVSPVRTARASAGYQGRYKSNHSYPGFFNDDQNIGVPGRQPELGNGNPSNGDPWGTWGGYFDWDVNTVVDSTQRWECTVFLIGQAPVAIDNFQRDSAISSISVRKPNFFKPLPSTLLNWRLLDINDNMVLQSGTTQPGIDGVVSIDGLKIFKDPLKTRLIIETAVSTGISDFGNENQSPEIFPNPAWEFVTIHSQISGEWKYQIYNALGVKNASGVTLNKTLSIKGLQTGYYLLILEDCMGNRYSKRILIQK